MGVPRLFPWILKNFGKCRTHFKEGDYTLVVENLLLDANAILHPCAQEVYNYGAKKSKMDRYGHLSDEEKQLKVFNMFFDFLKTLSRIVTPTEVLYIAIDGPAPLSKQAQQRQRRFAAALERKEGFDSNKLTPGTPFMFEFTKFMHTAIRKEMNDPKSSWHNLKVIFSPPNVPGEGEHKLQNFIRSDPKSKFKRHCVYGPDGDLIMLTLSAHMPKIFLFREDQYDIGYYDILDMGYVRKTLVDAIGQRAGYAIEKRTINDVTNDFILFGFFVGNDFLPKIQMFMYLEDGLELMNRTYATLSKGGLQYPLSNANKINHEGFTRFIGELAHREHNYIFDQSKPDPNRPPLDEKFKNITLLKNIKDEKLDMVNYKKDYYKKVGISTDEEIKQMCLDYVRSIAWVFEYYVNGLPSWRDFYAWHYAPLMTDLALTLRDISKEELSYVYTFKMDKPSTPFVQLLSVLPPASSVLLPLPFRKLFKGKLYELGYYPETFEIDLEGKTKEHMGVALLPFVDIDEIENAYTPIFKSLKNRYIRNDLGQTGVFQYDPKYTAKYKSDYGNIKTLKIKKSFL